MTETTDRKLANIRIYCDQAESRWEKRIDSKTKKELGGWIDKENWLIYPFKNGVNPGCLYEFGGAETFSTYRPGNPPEPQLEPRSTISVSVSLFAT